MKNLTFLALLAAIVFLKSTADGFAAGAVSSALSAGATYHKDHSVFTELPFGDGDISCQLAYEAHNAAAFWQFVADYAPDLTGTNDVDYAITPQINLLFKDGAWRGGAGALASYLAGKGDRESDWTSVYWQFLLGFEVPVGGLNVGAQALYRFETWGDLGDFDVGDIEYGGWISYHF